LKPLSNDFGAIELENWGRTKGKVHVYIVHAITQPDFVDEAQLKHMTEPMVQAEHVAQTEPMVQAEHVAQTEPMAQAEHVAQLNLWPKLKMWHKLNLWSN
jgi:hypothetical protein